ncbi:MAG: Holliday junction resolvase RuvX [Desulfovibrionaceae bacterium]|nr:Holliday junction resolvase RuvX [Desulfovibrionaceae bacterium]
MKYLGIDYGDERTGLAVCDQGERMAFALKTLHRKTLPGREEFLRALLAIAEEQGAGGLVIGLPLPLNPDPDMGEPRTCRKARNFAARLGRRTSWPIYLINEALSSSEAEERLRQAGFKGQKLKDKLDAEAAAVILQQFLNLPLEQRALCELAR